MTEHLIIRTSYCRYNVGFVWLGFHACYAVSETGLVCKPLTYLCRVRVWVTQINREHMMNLMATSIQAGRAMLL